MAKTLTVADGLNYVAMKYPRLLTDGFAARIADEVIAFMWHRYPWRGTLEELPPFFPVREEPDYGPPSLVIPSDFYGLHEAWLRRSTGERIEPNLLVKPNVEISIAPGFPTAIAYQSERGGFFRLHPRPSFAGPEIQVEGIYKKLPVKVTNENMNSYVLPWDDIYFQVFRKGLEWQVKDLMGNPDAANAFLMFRAFVDDMAANEGLHSGVVTIAPAEGLELGG